jgi:hypothetical protein
MPRNDINSNVTPLYPGITIARDVSFGPHPKDLIDIFTADKGGANRTVLMYLRGAFTPVTISPWALFRIRGIMVVAEAIGRCLLPVRHAIVPNYAGNAQPVVTKHTCSSYRLGDAVRLQFSPLFYCCLISKEGE